MKIFDKVKTMNIDELAEFLEKMFLREEGPWDNWFAKKYCNVENCPSIKCECTGEFKGTVDCAWCELNDGCKFFPKDDFGEKLIIKLWLESEAE